MSGTVDAVPPHAFVRSLERGISAGPAVVAVNACGARPVIYVLEGLMEVDTVGAAFDAEDLSGRYTPTQDAVRARRDSLIAHTPSACLVRADA